jgi:hypothetical protein
MEHASHEVELCSECPLEFMLALCPIDIPTFDGLWIKEVIGHVFSTMYLKGMFNPMR